ncbi:sporulation membrane protein YtaF [Pseudobacteroides cellulosolvens]|uniref:Sporulation protein YtaF n=1 Tax=Pseudobacteroides cellulosolvens ATCC 35603 = DSM 2933 TaxID=398512 RepID=A0A0L6JTK9_9FIRM|nr:sporulation membrane protein YtaF [Pseudobacteroides cellulosolvens]KNY29153.1 sporulation protein YtaF [Pseudobacteroides cellulosolvens ATCC 35603 = DSM 2933]
MTFTIILLAVSLSTDALGVGTVYGLRRIRIPLGSKLFICFFSIIYSAVAQALGKTLSSVLSKDLSNFIGVGILFFMGIWIILQSIMGSNESPRKKELVRTGTLLEIAIKSLGITIQIIRNPIEVDFDKSGTIDLRESILLGFALSLDAIGVGIGSSLAGCQSILIPFAVGFFQLIFLYIGLFIGNRITSYGRINKKIISIIPGILLIALGISRLI